MNRNFFLFRMAQATHIRWCFRVVINSMFICSSARTTVSIGLLYSLYASGQTDIFPNIMPPYLSWRNKYICKRNLGDNTNYAIARIIPFSNLSSLRLISKANICHLFVRVYCLLYPFSCACLDMLYHNLSRLSKEQRRNISLISVWDMFHAI